MEREPTTSPWCRRLRYRPRNLRPPQGPRRDTDAVKRVHELQTHQRELELQNEALQQAKEEAELRNRELQAARAEAQAALERYARFYDCAPVAYLTLDRNGRICQLNRAAAGLLGGERRQLLDRRFGSFVEPEDRHAFDDFLAGVFAGEGKECRTVALRGLDRRQPPAYAHLEGVQRESGLSCNIVAIDVSERKRAELILERYRSDLEATVAERTAELSAANRELEGFVYAASHDMKAPLARLGSLSGLLEEKLRTQLADAEGLVLLDLIQQNALRLTALVDDLLAHTQIRQQPLSFQTLDIAGIVQAILLEQADDIRQKGAEIRLDFPAGMSVQGDLFSLGQVLRNLVENALKYSAKATPPVIEIGGRVEDGKCRLWVRDNGIGINKAYHELIFEIFRRLHSYSEYPGTGVGLALVKKAIERMGGEVGVDSALGQGATFHVEWPMVPAPAKRSMPA